MNLKNILMIIYKKIIFIRWLTLSAIKIEWKSNRKKVQWVYLNQMSIILKLEIAYK